MPLKLLSFLTSIILLSGCDFKERELRLNKKEEELTSKEQQLLLQEKQLQLREVAIAQKEKMVDSTLQVNLPKDSSAWVDSSLLGSWQVRMECTETNCVGSAVGDKKTEQWEFSLQGLTLLATARANNKVVRIYTGHFLQDAVELTVQPTGNALQNSSMKVRLQKSSATDWEGTREIIQEDHCKIVYALGLKKQ